MLGKTYSIAQINSDTAENEHNVVNILTNFVRTVPCWSHVVRSSCPARPGCFYARWSSAALYAELQSAQRFLANSNACSQLLGA